MDRVIGVLLVVAALLSLYLSHFSPDRIYVG